MPLTNTQLKYYDSNVLRLPSDKRTEYHAQVDRLISELSKNVRNHTEIKITKVIKAGSFAKYTILRKASDSPVDVDVVFYISGKNASHETLATLSEKIHELLIKIYPTKKVEDFEIRRKAATVTFSRTGLSVDIVPVIEDAYRPDFGWQFDLNGEKVQTCASCQIQFVRDRKDEDADFRTLVRLAKKWRNYTDLTHLKSFAIELIMAHVLAVNGTEGSIESRFRGFLLYIANSELKEKIQFPENKPPYKSFADPVVILDPVSSENNVASRITEEERKEIVTAALTAWEAANFASIEDDPAVWKEIFGPSFKTEDNQ